MESAKIARQVLKDENLLMTGMILTILGFYAIAEWEVLAGLFIVISSYVIIITSTKIGKQSFQVFISKMKRFNKISQKNKKEKSS